MTVCLVCDTDRPEGAAVLTGFPSHFCPLRPLHGPAEPHPPTYRVCVRMEWNPDPEARFGWVFISCGALMPCADHGPKVGVRCEKCAGQLVHVPEEGWVHTDIEIRGKHS